MQHLSWEQVEELAKALASKIKAGGFRPDYLIGVTAGGLIPLALLAEELNIRSIVTISAKSYDGNKKGKLNITYLPQINLENQKVLLIDEIAETGQTLKQISEVLTNQYKVGELKTATLAINAAQCQSRPDFFALEDNQKVFFPWEKDSHENNSPA